MRLGKFKLKHYINYIAIGLFTIIMACIVLSGNRIKSSTIYMFEGIAINVILAVSLSLVVGFLGELSLGHAGFMCVGAYIGAKIGLLLQPTMGDGIETFLIALIFGAVAAGICGILIGLPALRLRGDYLAIVTLAFGEIVRSIFRNLPEELFGGQDGLDTGLIRFDKRYYFLIAFVLVLVTLAIVQNLMRSKHGRSITAIRDNEIAARATGVNVTGYKLLVFTISAMLAGVAGVVYSFCQTPVKEELFTYNKSIDILIMVVLGGMGNINGTIISAILITYLKAVLPNILTNDLAVLQNLLYALILIVIVIYNNAPALKGFRDKYNFGNFFAKFKKKHDPSNIQDDKAKWDVVPTKISMDEILSVDLAPQDFNHENGGEQ